jgi:hypothetical protein
MATDDTWRFKRFKYFKEEINAEPLVRDRYFPKPGSKTHIFEIILGESTIIRSILAKQNLFLFKKDIL